jgi:hypothetical protein
MAKEYLEKLSKIIEELNIDDLIEQPLEVKHFSVVLLFISVELSVLRGLP